MRFHLYRLFYVSRSVPGFDSGVEIGRILERSRARNEKNGVTGALYYDGSLFAQVLEGPLPALEATYEIISRDMRHEGLKVLELSLIDQRQFAGWAMATIDPAEMQKLVNFDLENLPPAGVLVSGMFCALADPVA